MASIRIYAPASMHLPLLDVTAYHENMHEMRVTCHMSHGVMGEVHLMIFMIVLKNHVIHEYSY